MEQVFSAFMHSTQTNILEYEPKRKIAVAQMSLLN